MKVTITDVARAAGVAKSTVSKVLNDSPRISQETKLRVRAIMKEMNYTPSSTATRLARQNSSTIGLLIDMSKESEFLNQFFYSIIGGIESVLGTLKYDLTIANVQNSDPEGGFLSSLVLGKRVDGIIANTSVLTEEMCAELNRLGFPYVSIGELPSAGAWVDCNNEAGGAMLTGHLLKQGYTDVAFVGGQQESMLFTRRLAGYEGTLRQAGLTVRTDRIINGAADEEDGYLAARGLLQSGDPPDSIICMSNYAAFGVLKAASELGVAIPAQLGVATFDDYPLSRYTTPPLTSLNMDTFQLGAAAGRLLLEQVEGQGGQGDRLLLEPELIVRSSTWRS
ncbi:LacI family DNA-binding transcriptional regulator [Paenibacillus sp. PK3_47]|uniref:LacI family DNA-binding transcriptional regulator n=1 Tax=Paenibacillus sp. PK3_47 TaxID=2072642 RepID=UPI00201D8D07|nr:LacI family DNA-binding transcriptional regulator [Paenibacillus sp. PK3_47]